MGRSCGWMDTARRRCAMCRLLCFPIFYWTWPRSSLFDIVAETREGQGNNAFSIQDSSVGSWALLLLHSGSLFSGTLVCGWMLRQPLRVVFSFGFTSAIRTPFIPLPILVGSLRLNPGRSLVVRGEPVNRLDSRSFRLFSSSFHVLRDPPSPVEIVLCPMGQVFCFLILCVLGFIWDLGAPTVIEMCDQDSACDVSWRRLVVWKGRVAGTAHSSIFYTSWMSDVVFWCGLIGRRTWGNCTSVRLC
ncbi:hypothetical protein FA15DRAFT_420254 [Coprinopsis marcescibilis]|uniref:Uncharacterized protein n=1 Tax=Coprinopsis marcescibilis TaxID=230819 RepID=A0A5C3K958_COPMA|nr:hypothetical protein FA15DRAFT_420254 [Coprinopsis marcescibilis]